MFSFFKKRKVVVEQSAKVVPRVKTYEFLEALKQFKDMPEDSKPIHSPLLGDLLVTYSIDIGPSYVSASPVACKEHNLNIEDVPRQAMANALKLLGDIKTNTDGYAFEMITGNDMEACTILFPELWTQISTDLQSDVVAIFPHRNRTFYTRSSSEQGIHVLRSILDKTDFSETHALSKELFLYSNKQWSVFAA